MYTIVVYLNIVFVYLAIYFTTTLKIINVLYSIRVKIINILNPISIFCGLHEYLSKFSSSWDNTARVWNLNTPQLAPIILKGHQAAVWAALELGNGTYATASADKTIKLWRKDGGLIISITGKITTYKLLLTLRSIRFEMPLSFIT